MRTAFFVEILLVSTLLVNSCTVIKKRVHSSYTIEGSYKIVTQEPYDTKNALVVGAVNDKEVNEIINFAVVHIPKIKKGASTDSLGRFSFEVSEGIYKVEVFGIGYTTIITNPIEFKAGTKTEIIFDLGTSVIE